MRLAVVKESRPGERRVAAVPDLVPKLTALGFDVRVEPGAGAEAGHPDAEYAGAGATVDPGALDGAAVTIAVQPLGTDQVARLADGAAVVSFLPVETPNGTLTALRDGGVTTFAMELIPRISRAQAMDALSSQSLVTGYRCAIIAAERLRRFFPLSMTAAGTVPPAQVVVLGAGVAGLQAIATARRLGAVVKAYDVRAAAAEEIASMGAQPIELDLETLEGAGGYAREMTEDRAARQRDLLTPYIAAADALITTAAVPGRRAPLLVTRDMVERMRAGAVVVDLAAESGGNVEGAVPGEEVMVGNALLVGGRDLASQMPGPASRLYAQNIVNLLGLMTADDTFRPDLDDEVVAGCCVTHAGEIRHQPTRERVEGGAA